MCECGCTMNNDVYRLPGGKGFLYVVELYAGCRNCTAPPGVVIHRITPGHWDYNRLKDVELLPLHKFDSGEECAIKVGLDPDEFAKAVDEQVNGYDVGQKKLLDEHDAYEIAAMVWDEAVHGAPALIEVKEKAACPANTKTSKRASTSPG